jgi:hypothetical protein
MKKSFTVRSEQSGRVVRIKVCKIWRDYIDTVNQFDDLTLEERAKIIADTLIHDPDHWKTWFQEHIAHDWAYILTIGKVVKEAKSKRVRQIIRYWELS